MAKPSDGIEFEISPLDRALVDIVADMKGPSHWRAFNAIRHANAAWKLRTLDREMSLFRAVTAEEEAASAIIMAVQQLKYPHATKLNHRNHVHKAAVIPFFDAVTRDLARTQGAPPLQLYLDDSFNPARVRIRFKMSHPDTGEDVWVMPVGPLHFKFSISRESAAYAPVDFSGGVAAVVKDVNAGSIIEHITERANFRNRLLYAADNGYPRITTDIIENLKSFIRNTMTLVRIYGLVRPWTVQQNFVAQSVTSLVRVLKLVPDTVRFE